MGESLRDYFINFLFKTDKNGAQNVQNQISKITGGLEKLSVKSFAITQITSALREVFRPFEMLGEMVARTGEEADALQELSDRTGIATEQLEKMGYIAEMSGTSLDTLTTGFRFLEKNMVAAHEGSKETAQAFARLGVSIYGAGGKLKTVEELLPAVSAHISKLPTHAQKSAAAMDLFGKAGQQLLPLLERGPDQLRALQEELELLGGVTSEEFLAIGSAWDDSTKRMTQTWTSIRQAISGPILAALNKVTDKLIAWWKAMGDVVRSKIAYWAQHLVDTFESFYITLSKIGGALLLFAALLNAPLLIMIGMKLLIGLLIEDFAYWMAGNDSLIGRTIANWDAWLMKIKETHPVLGAALEFLGGFVSAASEGIHSIFLLFDTLITSFVEGGWAGFIDELSTTWATAVEVWKAGLEEFFEPVIRRFEQVKDAIYNVFMSIKKTAKALGLDGIGDLAGDAASTIMGGTGRSNVTGDASLSKKDRFLAGPPMSGVSDIGYRNKTAPPSIANNATSVEVNIANVPNHMNERDLAVEIAKQFNMQRDAENRAAHNQLVPERY